MFDEDFLERTRQQWERFSPALLTKQDALEIASNMAGLLKLLVKINQREKLLEDSNGPIGQKASRDSEGGR